MTNIQEGSATILLSKSAFYNPKMRKLRDISVIFLRALGSKKMSLLDATAATGIRGIRYSKEAGIKNISMIDINAAAVRVAKRNAKLNGLKATILNKSVQEFANTSDQGFDAIDVDPFGTPAPLIHDLLKVSKNGAVLMVTATDTATLCGAEGGACLRIYGARPAHNELCHEVGVRILINFIAREAAQFNFGVEPLLSISDMHYMRVFLRLKRSSVESIRAIKSSGFGAYCSNCHSFAYQKGIVNSMDTKCGYCGKKMIEFGPIWLGNLQDKNLIAKMLKLSVKYQADVAKLMRKIYEELDIPLLYYLPRMTRHTKQSSVPLEYVLNELNKKRVATRTHFEENAIKTTAPVAEIIKIIRDFK